LPGKVIFFPIVGKRVSVEDLNDALRDETDESEGEAGIRKYLPPYLLVNMGRGTDESEGEAGIRYYLPPCLLVNMGRGTDESEGEAGIKYYLPPCC
jgi:hypothetical protein